MQVSSQNSGIDVNLSRVSSNSRPFSKQAKPVFQSQKSDIIRENPIPKESSNFVIVDGMKLDLSARRGTYVDLLV